MESTAGPSPQPGDKLPPVSELKFDGPDGRRPQPFTFGAHQAAPHGGPSISSSQPTSQPAPYPSSDGQRDIFRPPPTMSPPISRRSSGDDDDARRSHPPVRTQLPPLAELMMRSELHPVQPPMGPPPSSFPHSLPPSHALRPTDSPHNAHVLPHLGDPSRISEPMYGNQPPRGPYGDDGYNRGPAPYTNGQGSMYPPPDRQSQYTSHYNRQHPQHYSGAPPPNLYSSQEYTHGHPSEGPYDPRDPHQKVLGKRTERYGPIVERALAVSAVNRELDVIRDHAPRVDEFVRKFSDTQLTNPKELVQKLQRVQQSLHVMTEAVQNAEKQASSLIGTDKMDATSMYPKADDPYYSEEARRHPQPSEPKRVRRGRPAPPGRCHSCNRSETPEWRRGPDGARTLCNACGLHFAKISRKNSKNQVSST